MGKVKKGLLALGVMLLIAGCVSLTAGNDFDISSVENIVKNTTTKDEIHQWFGSPYMTGVDNGDEAWTYEYVKAGTKDTKIKSLYIVFGKTGNVKSFTFSTNFPDEMTATE